MRSLGEGARTRAGHLRWDSGRGLKVWGERMEQINMRLEATVHGRVQGVFFRRDTLAEAERLGLSGTVRNLLDGTVRVLAEGDRESLERFLSWLRHGPEGAEVERVEGVWREATGAFRGFRVIG
jgi:acylphosphatase